MSDGDRAQERNNVRVVNLNDHDLLNRRFNGFDLKRPLEDLDIDTTFIVWRKGSDETAVKGLRLGRGSDILRNALGQLEKGLGVQNLIQPYFLRIILDDRFRRADVVHLHLIHNELVSLLVLPWLSRRKHVVWTLHDPWLLTGHCIYPMECLGWKEGCSHCEHMERPKKMRIGRAGSMFRLKRRLVQRSDITFIAASEHMRSMMADSEILRGKKVELIPFGLPLERYLNISDNVSRNELGIGTEDLVIVFRSAPGPFKGTAHALKALIHARLPKNTTIVTFGKPGMAEGLSDHYRIIDLGWATEEQMSWVLGAADMLIMPSMAEAFGMLAIESMASGVPVIAFEGTALGEIVQNEVTGRLVEQGDCTALTLAIEELAADPSLRERMGANGRRTALERYAIERQARDIAALYRKIVEKGQR
ncbi:MAG: glycosyltransferase [Methanomassiliicoccales archaeon]